MYAASPDDVWSALLNYEKHPMTGKQMKSVEPRPDENGLPVWVEDMGRGELITVKTVEATHPYRMVREMSSTSVPMTSRWVYELEAVNDHCKLTLRSETDIKTGSWHGPFFSPDDEPGRRG